MTAASDAPPARPALHDDAAQPSATLARTTLHQRTIVMTGYAREDGLFEIEGRVTDTKPHGFTPPGGNRHVRAGEPLHDMSVCMVFDAGLVVRDVAYVTHSSPYPACQRGGESLRDICGLRIAAGWSAEVKRRLGGARSCTHLMELLLPMATTAMQSMSVFNLQNPTPRDAAGRPTKIDSCFAYARDGEVVLRRWPEFHRPLGEDGGGVT